MNVRLGTRYLSISLLASAVLPASVLAIRYLVEGPFGLDKGLHVFFLGFIALFASFVFLAVTVLLIRVFGIDRE